MSWWYAVAAGCRSSNPCRTLPADDGLIGLHEKHRDDDSHELTLAGKDECKGSYALP